MSVVCRVRYAGANPPATIRVAGPRASERRRETYIRGGRFVRRAIVALVAACLALGAAPLEAQLFPKRTAAPAPAKAGKSGVKPASATAAAAPAPVNGKPFGPPPESKLRVVAVVNRDEITRIELGKECLIHYGSETLDGLVSKQLIVEHCERLHVNVTTEEVQAEIERLAKQFQLPVEQWLKMLEKERGVKPRQYGNDVIWPLLALKKVARAELVVSKAEIEQGFQSEFGPAVKVRLIALSDEKKARSVLGQAQAKPEEFGALARKYSEDVNSASANGLVQPIRHYVGDKILEDVAFRLKEGEISPLVPVGEMYVILMCEGQIPGVRVDDRVKIDGMLEAALRERKTRAAGMALFKRLREQSVIEEIYSDPVKSKQLPGVAAVVNGHQISVAELSDECIERHGTEVLEGLVNRRIVEQSLRKANVEVAKADIDAEVARSALAMGKVLKPGVPDVEGWVEYITKEQCISRQIYIQDQIWPSVALKKIVGAPEVTEDDLHKGFEANFGPRMRVKAIVLTNQRKAQEVWEKARNNPTAEFFGKLAENYSIEANSRALKGDVPPIQRYGGQPELEKEAFKLEPGQMSAIIQAGPNFVILYCEGRTTPQKVQFSEVRQEIYNDLKEKKLRLAMGKQFEKMRDSAAIDNFLTGVMHGAKPGETVVDGHVRSANHAEAIGAPGKGHAGHTYGGASGRQQRDPDSTTIDDLIKDDKIPQ